MSMNAGTTTTPRQPLQTAMRLLIIEDDRDAADYLVKAFSEVGHVALLCPRVRILPARNM